MTFDEIMSHCHIAQIDFYKYLKLDIMLMLGMMNHFLENFFFFVVQTQKFISKFYSMLYEHRAE